MGDMMTFPSTWEEFEKIYGFEDSQEIYTNGDRLIPSFRVKQWLEHESTLRWIPCNKKMPDKNVLCCNKNGEIMIGYVYKDNVESDTGYSAESEGELMYDCVAWMPLPQPYTESEDKE